MLAQILSNLIVQSAARIGDDEAAAVEFRRQAQLMIEMGESVAAASPSSAATHFLQAMGVLSKLPDADEEVDQLSRRRDHADGERRRGGAGAARQPYSRPWEGHPPVSGGSVPGAASGGRAGGRRAGLATRPHPATRI